MVAGISKLVLVVSAVSILVTGATAGSRVVYLGRDMASGGGMVQDDNGTQYRVGLGDSIAGLGTVTEISDGGLVCRYELSDAEKVHLRGQHAVVYDVREVRIPRLDTRIIPMVR